MTWVALLAEGVDRNLTWLTPRACYPLSPSSRRAWIEMMTQHHNIKTPQVALLAEGVDRNFLEYGLFSQICVALLAEGVDRNPVYAALAGACAAGRPPRGGRG